MEDQVDWNGEREAMVNAMMDVGFLHKTSKGYYIHDWQEHEGHLKSYRDKARAAHEARRKKKKEAQANAKEVAEEIAQANAQEVEDSHTMQCNAVHTTTTTTTTGDDSKNTLEPEHHLAPGVVLPEVPEDLASLARENLGDDGAAFVRNYLALYDADWIRAAILELAHEPKAGTRRRRLMYKLLDYKANGGPPTGEERSTRSTSRGQGVSRQKGGKYAELDKRAYTG